MGRLRPAPATFLPGRENPAPARGAIRKRPEARLYPESDTGSLRTKDPAPALFPVPDRLRPPLEPSVPGPGKELLPDGPPGSDRIGASYESDGGARRLTVHVPASTPCDARWNRIARA